ncbi:MAG TPA: site-2 protease family protein, partial [Thermoleophilia bacterium]|nr:site-2 protease family protein [Thermoleophilia bacterium]
MGRGVKIGRLFGIEIGIHPSWIIIFLLTAYTLAQSYLPSMYFASTLTTWLVATVLAVLLFVSVLIHELAHSLVAKAQGIPVRSITLFLLGGLSSIEHEPSSPGREAVMAGAGPASSLAIGLACGLAARLTSFGSALHAMFVYLAFINIALAIFNLLPGFPLDGGRVLRAIVWGAGGSLVTATRVAATAGRVVGVALIALGLWQATAGAYDGLWAILLGWFVIAAAGAGERQTLTRDRLEGATAGELMTPNPLGLDPDLSLAAAVDGYFLRYPYRVYPVRDILTPLGLLTIERVQTVDPADWPHTSVRDVMLPLEGAVVAPEA